MDTLTITRSVRSLDTGAAGRSDAHPIAGLPEPLLEQCTGEVVFLVYTMSKLRSRGGAEGNLQQMQWSTRRNAGSCQAVNARFQLKQLAHPQRCARAPSSLDSLRCSRDLYMFIYYNKL